MGFYDQHKIKESILNFSYSGFQKPVRGGAIYDKHKEKIIRQGSEESDQIVLDSEEKVSKMVRKGAKSFYASYWRYEDPSEIKKIKGRDLVWTIEAKDGGIKIAKKLTDLFLEALETRGFPQPLIKYSGEMGFDVLIPTEDLQISEKDNLSFLSNLQEELTKFSMGYIHRKTGFTKREKNSRIRFSAKAGTCFLTEHKWRRGLILAPMSLHPSSELVSVPVAPSEIPEFSVLDATPDNAKPKKWDIGSKRSSLRTEMEPRPVSA